MAIKTKAAEIQYHIDPTHFMSYNPNDLTWRIEIHLPGISKDQIKIKYVDDSLVVEAKRGNAEYHVEEYLPFEVVANSIKGKYENGLLEITGNIKDPMAEAYEIKLQ